MGKALCRGLCGAAALLLISAAANMAGAYLPARPSQVVCPLTGESFEFTGDYASFGRSLDFEPLVMGMLRRSPSRIPQCPGSDLPVYRAFTPAEVEKLRVAVMTPAWQERKAVKSAFYLVAYARHVLGDGELPVAQALLQAVWGAEDTNKAFLIGKAIESWSRIADTRREHDTNWTVAHWLRIDLNRQRGEFDKADHWLRDFSQRFGASHAPVSDGMIALEHELIAARDSRPAKSPPEGPR